MILRVVTAQESALFQQAVQRALQRHVDYPRVKCQSVVMIAKHLITGTQLPAFIYLLVC